MKPVVFAPLAIADLRDIAGYIAMDDPDRALTFVADLENRATAAASRPLAFRQRGDISPGLRAIRHGRYLIFFRDLAAEVRIVRVIHGARDLARLFDA